VSRRWQATDKLDLYLLQFTHTTDFDYKQT
jgi:hypothetical protein